MRIDEYVKYWQLKDDENNNQVEEWIESNWVKVDEFVYPTETNLKIVFKDYIGGDINGK